MPKILDITVAFSAFFVYLVVCQVSFMSDQV